MIKNRYKAVMLPTEKTKNIMKELTLRDKIAMSMDRDTLPEITNERAINYIAEKLGLEWSDDPLKQIEFAFQYEAIMRYQYADAMLKVRG